MIHHRRGFRSAPTIAMADGMSLLMALAFVGVILWLLFTALAWVTDEHATLLQVLNDEVAFAKRLSHRIY